jgi:ribA/ribD-fused uncharacterized protein
MDDVPVPSSSPLNDTVTLDDTVPYSQDVIVSRDPPPSDDSPCLPPVEFRIVKGKKDPLSNFYPCELVFDDIRYKSVEHFFQFVRAAARQNVSLAKRIWSARDAQLVKYYVKQSGISSDFEFDVRLMRQLLELKFEQCPDFRDALRETRDIPLLHSTYESDLVWATGLDYRDEEQHAAKCLSGENFPGLNIHGALLMELRSKFFGSHVEYDATSPSCVQSDDSPPIAKPPSLLDVKVDSRFIYPWFAKHGYYGLIPPSSVQCNSQRISVPFHGRSTFVAAPPFRQSHLGVYHM